MRPHVWTTALILVACGCTPVHFPLKVEAEYVFDPTGAHLLSGPPGPEVERIKAVIAARHEVDYEAWLVQNFSCPNPAQQAMWEKFNVRGATGPDFATLGGANGGFRFASPSGTLSYREERARLYEGYKFYLGWTRPDGRPVWERRAPFMALPVYPLVIDGYVLYLTGRRDRYLLVGVSCASGKTLFEHDVTQEGYQFYHYPGERPLSGYYQDRFAVLQPDRSFDRGPGTKSTHEWGNIRVLRLPPSDGTEH